MEAVEEASEEADLEENSKFKEEQMNEDIEDLLKLIQNEAERQENEVCLIASENYVSKDILKAQGSILTNKYSEGYPDKRYYGGCRIVDEIEKRAIWEACTLFQCNYANVQPHSGSQANQAVYLAFCQPYSTILGMNLDAGGHLTHGSKVSSSGKLYKSFFYGLDENGVLDYEGIKESLKQQKPRVLVVGASAYPRIIDFKRIREMVDAYNKELKVEIKKGIMESKSGTFLFNGVSYNMSDQVSETIYDNMKCIFMVDMAHIAGLVATGLHPSPLPYADVVTSTTHKTLRGPRGGLILCNDSEIAKKIDKAVFPGIQGGPLQHIIAAKAICFMEAKTPAFKDYMSQVLKNIKAMEKHFKDFQIDMVSGGSDNHLLLLDLRKTNISGKQLEDKLSEYGIVVNKNAVFNDPKPKSETSGIRIGTAAVTTRGFKEEECKYLANVICAAIMELSISKKVLDKPIETVKELCRKFPIYNK